MIQPNGNRVTGDGNPIVETLMRLSRRYCWRVGAELGAPENKINKYGVDSPDDPAWLMYCLKYSRWDIHLTLWWKQLLQCQPRTIFKDCDSDYDTFAFIHYSLQCCWLMFGVCKSGFYSGASTQSVQNLLLEHEGSNTCTKKELNVATGSAIKMVTYYTREKALSR